MSRANNSRENIRDKKRARLAAVLHDHDREALNNENPSDTNKAAIIFFGLAGLISFILLLFRRHLFPFLELREAKRPYQRHSAAAASMMAVSNYVVTVAATGATTTNGIVGDLNGHNEFYAKRPTGY
jgi:hypothetical protein